MVAVVVVVVVTVVAAVLVVEVVDVSSGKNMLKIISKIPPP